MRMLKYAILGLISREPMSGYDIMKSFEEDISKFWEAKHSQIYPELSRLQDEGLVDYTVTIQGAKLEKKIYTITDAGMEDLKCWLQELSPIEPVPKDCFRLKLFFSESLTEDQLQPVVQNEYTQHKARMDTLTARCHELGNPIPPVATPEFGDYMLVRGGMLREQAYLQWLLEIAQLLHLELS